MGVLKARLEAYPCKARQRLHTCGGPCAAHAHAASSVCSPARCMVVTWGV